MMQEKNFLQLSKCFQQQLQVVHFYKYDYTDSKMLINWEGCKLSEQGNSPGCKNMQYCVLEYKTSQCALV